MDILANKYFELLNGEYSGINLTRINTFEDFYNKQILDSILPLSQSSKFVSSLENNKYVVDVGFGGGFPIIPLAYQRKNNQFIGIETRAKKVKVVGEIASKLNIKNVNFFHSRIENVLIDMDCTITFKAVGKVFDFLSKLNLDARANVFFYKGPGFYELEKEQLLQAKSKWDLICEDELTVPGTEKRYLIGFRNKDVLRGTNLTKQLVKLSDIK